MHKILVEPIPAPADPAIAAECICICRKTTTDLNDDIVAVDIAETSIDVRVDMEDPPG